MNYKGYYMQLPKDTRPKYVSITETRCGKECAHLKEAQMHLQVKTYKCEPNHQFWYSTDKVVDFFAQGCPHFKPKPSEAQK